MKPFLNLIQIYVLIEFHFGTIIDFTVCLFMNATKVSAYMSKVHICDYVTITNVQIVINQNKTDQLTQTKQSIIVFIHNLSI